MRANPRTFKVKELGGDLAPDAAHHHGGTLELWRLFPFNDKIPNMHFSDGYNLDWQCCAVLKNQAFEIGLQRCARGPKIYCQHSSWNLSKSHKV